jgi:leader peptidase (prepilin peptidase)/N-methyltransferase
MPTWFFIGVLTLFGLLFGSFANVVVWRVPRGESIASPGSHCPRCDAAIAWYDNVPVLSWLLLRGRCRRCGEPIALRYPLVEVAAGVLFALAAVRFGASGRSVIAALFFFGLLCLALIDVEHYRLPNPIVAAMAVLGVGAAVAAQSLDVALAPLVGVGERAIMGEPLAVAGIGALAAGGLMFAVAEVYALVRKRPGLGMGDVKLLAVLGLYLGLYSFMALVVASLLGSVYAVVRLRGSGERASTFRLPFGAFLGAGAVITTLAGPAILAWYLGLTGL